MHTIVLVMLSVCILATAADMSPFGPTPGWWLMDMPKDLAGCLSPEYYEPMKRYPHVAVGIGSNVAARVILVRV